jgi:hypothetical protein
MIQVVNGYICYSGCDLAKAKHGENPRQKLGQVGDDPTKPAQGNDATDPAVRFGGSLAARAVSPAATGGATASVLSNQIDLFA